MSSMDMSVWQNHRILIASMDEADTSVQGRDPIILSLLQIRNLLLRVSIGVCRNHDTSPSQAWMKVMACMPCES